MPTATKGLLEKDKLSLQGFYAFISHMTLDLLALRTWGQQWLPLRHGLDAFFPHQARAEGECPFPGIPLGRGVDTAFCHTLFVPPPLCHASWRHAHPGLSLLTVLQEAKATYS